MSDAISHIRSVLRRYQTAQQVDTQASTEVGDGTAVRPEGRHRGSPEHLRDLTYALEALVGLSERQARAGAELQLQVAARMQDFDLAVLGMVERYRELKHIVLGLFAFLVGVSAATALAIGLALTLWWRLS